MVMRMLNHGYRVTNAPTHEYERAYGESHIAIFKEWPLFVWCVVRNMTTSAKPQPVPARSRATKPPGSVEIHE